MEAACAAAKRRGRPRAFDPEAVLETVLELFWENGFTATSLDDIAAATGVSRPSLAAAFGDKQALYIKAMERYQARIAEQLDQVLTCNGCEGGVRGIINRYFDTMIRAYTGEADHPLGCAFMCTALNEAPQHESILEMLQGTIENFDRRFEEFFTTAKDMGFLRPDSDPKILTQMISGLTSNLLVRARAGASRQDLQRITDQTTAFLFG
ncbi:MAG TPA: TetR/AcrR family transcriptional regulator [Asticcacaulis sp.]|nr:TetR/AcrR family transcriptional regulator [Asticcacaulis sp.]